MMLLKLIYANPVSDSNPTITSGNIITINFDLNDILMINHFLLKVYKFFNLEIHRYATIYVLILPDFYLMFFSLS
jgi:hypothetical protein